MDSILQLKRGILVDPDDLLDFGLSEVREDVTE
jgi:hypothetical protein